MDFGEGFKYALHRGVHTDCAGMGLKARIWLWKWALTYQYVLSARCTWEDAHRIMKMKRCFCPRTLGAAETDPRRKLWLVHHCVSEQPWLLQSCFTSPRYFQQFVEAKTQAGTINPCSCSRMALRLSGGNQSWFLICTSKWSSPEYERWWRRRKSKAEAAQWHEVHV